MVDLWPVIRPADAASDIKPHNFSIFCHNMHTEHIKVNYICLLVSSPILSDEFQCNYTVSWRILSCWMQCLVVCWKSTGIPEEHVTSILRVELWDQQEKRMKQVALGSLFNREEGGDVIVWNVSWLLTDSMILILDWCILLCFCFNENHKSITFVCNLSCLYCTQITPVYNKDTISCEQR
jgi:hypothetical protein